MRTIVVAVALLFSSIAAAQVPSPSDGIGLSPGAVAVPGSTGGAYITRAGVRVGVPASRIDAVRTSAYTNATTTPSTILTVTLSAATWHCRGRVNGTDSTAADGISIVVNTSGLTASATSSTTGFVATTAPLESPIVVTAGSGNTTLAVATFATGFVDYDAVLTVTTAGALVVSGAQNAHSTGTLTINLGSYILCEPL